MPKKQSTAAQRAREAARQGAKYTAALRDAAGDQPAVEAAAGVSEPEALRVWALPPLAPAEGGFGGHEFEYERETDLFRCTECRVYEFVARDTDGPITPCTGLVGYGGDTERVYLLLTENPALPFIPPAFLSRRVRATGIGRSPEFSWREGRLLVESAPSVVAELARRIEVITFAVEGRQVPVVSSVERLTAEEGRAVIAANRAAYAAEYGEPAR